MTALEFDGELCDTVASPAVRNVATEALLTYRNVDAVVVDEVVMESECVLLWIEGGCHGHKVFRCRSSSLDI